MITAEEIVVDGGFIAGAGYWEVATEAGFVHRANLRLDRRMASTVCAQYETLRQE
jgi:hypothetical protein